jgi:hypothetical protein
MQSKSYRRNEKGNTANIRAVFCILKSGQGRKEGRREGRKEGGKEGGREGRREGRKEGGREGREIGFQHSSA